MLTVLMLFNTFRIAFTYAYYYIDRDDFIEQFCVNKDKPEMKCNGKCHLKKVEKETTQKEKTPYNTVQIKEIAPFIVSYFNYSITQLEYEQTQNKCYVNLYSYLSIHDAFKPPKA